MLKAIIAIFVALPKLLDLIERLEVTLGPKWDEVLSDSAEAYAKFKDAKTPEERDEALKRVADSWHRSV